MPRRALVERRPLLLGSLTAAIAYYALKDGALGGLYLIGLKGAAVGMLAVYAALRHAGRDAAILVIALALAACGDAAIELDDHWGGALFLVSHLAAIALYLRNPRKAPAFSQKAAAAALLLLTPAIALALAADRPDAPAVAGYAVVLGAMAATAWLSRFPRYRVGLGALALVASDLLLFGGGKPAGLAVWPLYYIGQLLICLGVIQTLRRDHQA